MLLGCSASGHDRHLMVYPSTWPLPKACPETFEAWAGDRATRCLAQRSEDGMNSLIYIATHSGFPLTKAGLAVCHAALIQYTASCHYRLRSYASYPYHQASMALMCQAPLTVSITSCFSKLSCCKCSSFSGPRTAIALRHAGVWPSRRTSRRLKKEKSNVGCATPRLQ
jgi:hypothetical protein